MCACAFTGSAPNIINIKNTYKQKRRPTEVWMTLGLTCGQPLLVVISQQFVKEIDRFIWDVSLILWRDEARPGLLRIPVRVSIDVVLRKDRLCTVREYRRTEHPARYHTSPDRRKDHLFPKPLWSLPVDRSYHGHGKRVPCGISKLTLMLRTDMECTIEYHGSKHAPKTPHI